MPDRVMVVEPDLLSLEVWLASNPPEEEVRRWLMAIEAYYARLESQVEAL